MILMILRTFPALHFLLVALLSVGTVVLTPVALAQDATTDSASETPLQGAGQGENQGVDQGTENGGPTLESLGVTPGENGNYDASVLGDSDPRQGANQGTDAWREAQAETNADASNTQTGADSANDTSVASAQSNATDIENTSTTANTVTGAATTGKNSASENTGSSSVTTGDASVGVEQVTADNLNTVGSEGEIDYSLSAGSHEGDLVLEFDPITGEPLNDSFRSVNTVTGSGSDNTASVESIRETIVEIQNDGTIANTLDASAVSGENDASQNTGNSTIATGDANVAATLLNFLNASVIDGALWLEVADIFGDLNGNVVIPEEATAYLERRQRELLITATNAETGSDSSNSLDVDVADETSTALTNTADIENTVAIDAVTGRNSATQNTGNSTVTTGDVEATTNTVTLANMNVVDGNLGLIIVNAFNRWLGLLLGSDGSWTAIDHEYTTQILAENSQTGSDSTNAADVDVSNSDTTDVTNAARVTNNLNLAAITGENTANQNTGNASITTGDARVTATVVNVVNTNVVRGSFFITVVNVFGNWFGDFLFGGQSASALAQSGGGVQVDAANENTGSDSVNTIDVDVSGESDVAVENTVSIENDLVVNADTGGNQADRNTGLGSVDTGDALAALHARNIANVTLAAVGSPWANVTADLANATTGSDSTNTIDVTVNDDRDVTVSNDANVDTAIGAFANTGFNTANRNTLGGLVTTGTASIDALIENLLNQTWLVGYEYGDDPGVGGVHVIGTNRETGSGSTNTTDLDVNTTTDVDVTNTADVDTDAELVATSGNNETNRNTGGGAVDSGDAAIAGGVDHEANQTQVAGAVPGSLNLNVDSDANIDTDVLALASSGDNEANRNTGELSPPSSSEGEEPPPSEDHGVAPPPSGVGGGNGGVGGGSAEERQEEPVPRASRPSVQGAHAVTTMAAAMTPRISAIGPIARFPIVPRVAQAAEGPEQHAEESVPAPSRFPTAGSDSRFVEAAARYWPWALLAAALGIVARLLGRARFLGIFGRRA